MKKLLIIVASKNKKSHTKSLIDGIVNEMTQIDKSFEFRVIHLAEMNIHECVGCECCFYFGTCSIQNDDLQYILDEIIKSHLFIEQLFDFLGLEEESKSGSVIINKIETIETKNLSYRYSNCNNYALHDINLRIQKGDTIAIVGRNGSGKSTLMKILVGLYDDYEGEVLINGIELRKINRDEYSKHIGALFQDFTKYEGTIRENICYSNLSAIEKDEKIKKVCVDFGISEFINAQKKKLDTQLGYWFESGKQISFGQWQKIALARTFIREADVYFLDEPNAAIDAISEYEMNQLYERIFHEKIGMIIVHKFNHCSCNANKIIVLKNGKSVGYGNHKTLLEDSEEYRKLYFLQK